MLQILSLTVKSFRISVLLPRPTLSIPIWNWAATQSRIKQAELRPLSGAARAFSRSTQNSSPEIRALYAEAETALNETRGLNRSAELAAESLRLITLRYKDGEATGARSGRRTTTNAQANSAYQDGAVALSRGAGQSANSYRGADNSMKPPMTTYMHTQKFRLSPVSAIGALPLSGMGGLWQTRQKRRKPLVSVRTSPAERAPISQLISTGGRRFPLQQAVITPKITSPIRQFLVQHVGSRVRQASCSPFWKTRIWPRRPDRSKGEFEQGRSRLCHQPLVPAFPSRCRKPNWTLPHQRRPLTRNRSYMTAASSYFSKARFLRGAISIPRKSRLRRRAASINKRRNNSTT